MTASFVCGRVTEKPNHHKTRIRFRVRPRPPRRAAPGNYRYNSCETEARELLSTMRHTRVALISSNYYRDVLWCTRCTEYVVSAKIKNHDTTLCAFLERIDFFFFLFERPHAARACKRKRRKTGRRDAFPRRESPLFATTTNYPKTTRRARVCPRLSRLSRLSESDLGRGEWDSRDRRTRDA